jgi:uncharacterized protein YdgA (DUF945 family)
MGASSYRHLTLKAVVVSALISSGGCVIAAAGAGAGGTVYFTGNGVESIITSSTDAALAATERAFEHFQLTRTEFKEEDGGAKLRVKGKTKDDETDVTVTLERESGDTTRLEVTAKTSLVTWDKDFAREIAEKIVEFTGTG